MAAKSLSTTTKERLLFIKLSNMEVEGGKPIWVGPYKEIEDARNDINQAIISGKNLVFAGETPGESKSVIYVEIVGKIKAQRTLYGLRSPLYNPNKKKNTLIDYIPSYEEFEQKVSECHKDITHRGRKRKGKSELQTIELRNNVSPIEPINKSEKLASPEKIIILTRYSGIIGYLDDSGLAGEIFSFPEIVDNPNIIKGKIVISIEFLPYDLAQFAKRIGIISVNGVCNKEELAQLKKYELHDKGISINWYIVNKYQE